MGTKGDHKPGQDLCSLLGVVAAGGCSLGAAPRRWGSSDGNVPRWLWWHHPDSRDWVTEPGTITNRCQWQGQKEDYVAGTAQRGILSSLAFVVLVASIYAQPTRLLLSLPGISAKGRKGAEVPQKLQIPYFLCIKFLFLTGWMIFLNTVYAIIEIHYLFPQHHMAALWYFLENKYRLQPSVSGLFCHVFPQLFLLWVILAFLFFVGAYVFIYKL